jgi:hypothetical protein
LVVLFDAFDNQNAEVRKVHIVFFFLSWLLLLLKSGSLIALVL